ncbi:TPA: DUF2442 domain-containing protein [Salmonella enterica subsp. enterica serovar Typhimurium var. 5-]|uniref:DUF2442 domain-containing protein n=1 Tax=Salmonella enterica subsp. enterica serovar Typhimurium var. 5- TaxID=1620419 RepID=A0A740TTF0_SALTM|nr:DUF2442 domain-containing protein [Salmonella enterica subsp. enterica serovar Typhimurium var. 5-]
MRILSFYTTKTFKLIMEFENSDYRILDFKKVDGITKDLNIDLFRSAKLEEDTGNIRWENGINFDPACLYEASDDLDEVVKRQKKRVKPRKVTRLPDNYKSKITIENEKLIKLIRGD